MVRGLWGVATGRTCESLDEGLKSCIDALGGFERNPNDNYANGVRLALRATSSAMQDSLAQEPTRQQVRTLISYANRFVRVLKQKGGHLEYQSNYIRQAQGIAANASEILMAHYGRSQ